MTTPYFDYELNKKNMGTLTTTTACNKSHVSAIAQIATEFWFHFLQQFFQWEAIDFIWTIGWKGIVNDHAYCITAVHNRQTMV